jgi:ubiquinone/menaquinone biosynthesis C-methylase UbiE
MQYKTTNTDQKWDEVYSQKFMTMWFPHDDIIRFCARLIQKRLTFDRYDVKRQIETVLDLGCGNGRNAMFFAKQGFSVAGIDVSAQAIDWASEWSRREGLEVDFRVGDVSSLPFADASFDVVVSHGVLDHVPMQIAVKAAAEVARVLRPKGLFYCDLRSTEDFEYGTGQPVEKNTFEVSEGFEAGLVQHFFSQEEISELFNSKFVRIYTELDERHTGENLDRTYSRWVLAMERR